MHPLVIGIVATVGFIIILSVAYNLIKKLINQRNSAGWFKQHGKRIAATIMEVQTGQDWKYEEKWERDAWDGWQQKKSWQTYYDVTARWENSHTKRNYTFRSLMWSCDTTCRPVQGDTINVMVDPHNFKRYMMDFCSV